MHLDDSIQNSGEDRDGGHRSGVEGCQMQPPTSGLPAASRPKVLFGECCMNCEVLLRSKPQVPSDLASVKRFSVGRLLWAWRASALLLLVLAAVLS